MESHKITEKDLPKTFMVKLLGRKPAKGLWGIKNTRVPVDEMILEAKELNLSLPIVQLHVSEHGLHIAHFPKSGKQIKKDFNDNEVENSKPAVLNTFKRLLLISQRKQQFVNPDQEKKPQIMTNFVLLENLKHDFKYSHDESFFGIDSISYGVQDLIYTRVFSIIVLSDEDTSSRFHCYAFICEDRRIARDLTYSLSAAFQVYSRTIKARKPIVKATPVKTSQPKILSIDLSSPEDNRRGIGDSEA